MVGSGPDDGDVLEMGPERPRRRWAPGRRSRLVVAIAGVCALLAVGGTLAALRLGSRAAADPALARLTAEVTTVPVNAGKPGNLNAAWPGNASSGSFTSLSFDFGPTAVSGPPLTENGKPEVLYIATEFCPYCVAENWALIVALSRFGSFSGLSTSRSPYFEEIPPVDGWTFYGSSYTSRYLAFVPVETHSNLLVSRKADPGDPKSYRALQPLAPSEQAVLTQFDNGAQTPFLDFGGRVTVTGGEVVPNFLAGQSWTRIAAGLRRPATPAAATILTAANMLTSQLCKLTGDRPAAACPKWVR
jgi:hypothetical protein